MAESKSVVFPLTIAEYKETLQKLIRTREILEKYEDVIAAVYMPAVQLLSEAVLEIHEKLWESYKENNSPYGDTEEGMQRWLSEVTELITMQCRMREITTEQGLMRQLRN